MYTITVLYKDNKSWNDLPHVVEAGSLPAFRNKLVVNLCKLLRYYLIIMVLSLFCLSFMFVIKLKEVLN